MAIAFRSASVVHSSNETVIPTRPTGSIAGDLLLLMPVYFNNLGDSNGLADISATYTAIPGGIGQANLTGDGINSAQYLRISDGTASDLPTLTDALGGTGDAYSVALLAFSGATTPQDAWTIPNVGTTEVPHTCPTITAVASTDMLICLWGTIPNVGAAGRSYGSFGTTTPVVNTISPYGKRIYWAIAVENLASSGSTGTRTATSSYALTANDGWAASPLLLKAAAVASTPPGQPNVSTAAVQRAATW